jgi:hypothetical protein
LRVTKCVHRYLSLSIFCLCFKDDLQNKNREKSKKITNNAP